MSPVLIAGATGFIGRNLVQRLLADGNDVIAFVREGSEQPAEWAGRVDCIVLPDGGADDLVAALGGRRPNVVVNLAAYGVAPSNRDPGEMVRANISLAVHLVDLAARQGASVVMAGSCSEYAEPRSADPMEEGAPLEPVKLYGATKAAGGLMAMTRARQSGVPMRLLRLFNVYGPGEAAHRLLPTLVRAKLTGDKVALSAGTQIRDFVYVDDVAEAIVRSAGKLGTKAGAGSCEALNVCTGEGTAVCDFVSAAAERLGLSEDQLGFGDIPMRPDEVPVVIGNSTKLRLDLDWRPSYDVREGVRKALEKLEDLQR